MARKCRNWLLTYRDWTIPRTDAPENYIFWSGLFALASVLKRKVSVPKTYMGGYDIYPNLYIVFVGPPALRKSTAMDFANSLLDQIPSIHTSSDSMTQQVLAKRISENGDCSISIRIDELGTFINPSGMVMIDFLTAIYGGRRKFSTDTLSRNAEFSENPSVNLIAGTTPTWIAANLSEVMVGAGFTSRTIMIYEDELRARQLFYRELNHEVLEKLGGELLEDLVHISTLNGYFELTSDAKEFAEDWFNNQQPKVEKESDPRMRGYLARKHVHLLKIAMLLHLSYADTLTLTLDDIRSSLTILKNVEKRMVTVYQAVGKNPYTTDVDAILSYIRSKGKTTRKEVLSRFYHVANMNTLMDIVVSLAEMGYIKIEVNGTSNVTYTAIGGQSEEK